MMHPEFLTAALLEPAPHGFFTRRGGVSEGHFESLNTSASSDDAPGNVARNRGLIAAALDLAPDRLLGITQFHGTDVAIVDRPWGFGEGPRADAMACRTSGIGLGIVTADCAPVLFLDPDAQVIGAAHAGWRGAAAGVLEATIEAMLSLGAERARLRAVIGPCIGADSYEVADDMRDALLASDPSAAGFLAPGRDPHHHQFDLAGYGLHRLARAGIGEAHARALGIDTCADPDRFFSHRRRTRAGGHPLGHQMSVIRL